LCHPVFIAVKDAEDLCDIFMHEMAAEPKKVIPIQAMQHFAFSHLPVGGDMVGNVQTVSSIVDPHYDMLPQYMYAR